MALPKSLRFEILRRDNFACRYCGAKAPFVALHVDHVIPRKHGGTNARWNLTAACQACNIGKRDGVPTDDVIREVRLDEVTYQVSRGLTVKPCMYCARPVQFEADEHTDYPQCEPCNAAVCDAYDAGFRRAANRRT